MTDMTEAEVKRDVEKYLKELLHSMKVTIAIGIVGPFCLPMYSIWTIPL